MQLHGKIGYISLCKYFTYDIKGREFHSLTKRLAIEYNNGKKDN